MKYQWLYFMFVAVSVAVVRAKDELLLAGHCNEDLCKLPDCQCSSTTIPGNLTARDTPQFVTLTFAGSVSSANFGTYRQLLYDRKNSNGCNIGTTFFVRHEHTNYVMVNELYSLGFEIALNSISYRTPQLFWAEATYEDLVEEFADQRTQMAHFAVIPIDEIKGVRSPFLQSAGNVSFQVMKDYGLLYDSSWGTVGFQDPGLWPYTLDYASIQDCHVQPCPTASIPGVWVSPLVTWRDLLGFPCSSLEACIFAPDFEDEQAWFEFIMKNFERHYLGTRAPFDVAVTQGHLVAFPAIYRALDRFIEFVTRLPDAFMVNEGQVIEWSKNPVPIDEYRQQNCRSVEPTICAQRACELLSEHNGFPAFYHMILCTPCPARYPWIGNPLGK